MWIFAAAVGLYVALAAALDLRMRRIPNYLTVPAAVSGLLYHTLAPTGWGPWVSLAGFGVGFALLLLPWLAGGGGMGDVKLLAALGAWLGTKGVLIAFGLSAVLGAMMTLGLLLYHVVDKGVMKTEKRYLSVRQPTHKKFGKKRPARVLPFAVPVAMSTYLLLSWMITRGGL